MPQVYNKFHRNAPLDAVFVGRPTKFGNPFVIGEHGDREQIIILFEMGLFFDQELQQAVIEELRGKDLVCFCAPRSCHADVLLRWANKE